MVGFLLEKGGWVVRRESRDKKRAPGIWRKSSLGNLKNATSFNMAEAFNAEGRKKMWQEMRLNWGPIVKRLVRSLGLV